MKTKMYTEHIHQMMVNLFELIERRNAIRKITRGMFQTFDIRINARVAPHEKVDSHLAYPVQMLDFEVNEQLIAIFMKSFETDIKRIEDHIDKKVAEFEEREKRVAEKAAELLEPSGPSKE